MSSQIRGADLVARTLERAGLTTVFALSGNHIMPIYDAAFDTNVDLLHTRHEAAAVYMADAWARLTGGCGVALVSSGAGHANALGALPTALAAESPVLLLSGHAGLFERGKGGFQDIPQADMAAPVCKLSRTASDARRIGHDIAECIRVALSGRPGPVHLSLPVDLLDAKMDDTPDLWPPPSAFLPEEQAVSTADVEAVLGALRNASRPLVLGGPWLCRATGASLMAAAAKALGIPVLGMDSPRGINGPSLGAFTRVLAKADLVVLMGKQHDFTIRFGATPFFDADCRFVVVDPDPAMPARAGDRLAVGVVGSPLAMLKGLIERSPRDVARPDWAEEVAAAIAYRPQNWDGEDRAHEGCLHPAELCRGLETILSRDSAALLVCDGGELAQWPQTLKVQNRRLSNGPGASIGGATPFAIAARKATGATVISVMGDGAFGFHLAELDTAVRYKLPVVIIVGNDATWGAEQQIQLRTYGAARAHGCDLLPTRYDQVVTALGGHGEYVTQADDLVPALERAIASGLPACVNVAVMSIPAPVIR